MTPLLPGEWTAAEPYLARALDKGGGVQDWAMEDVYTMACHDQVALWGLESDGQLFGACVTTVTNYPRRRALEILLMGADDDREDAWRECLEQLRQVARTLGAGTIQGTGRPGWARKLGARERRVFELEV